MSRNSFQLNISGKSPSSFLQNAHFSFISLAFHIWGKWSLSSALYKFRQIKRFFFYSKTWMTFLWFFMIFNVLFNILNDVLSMISMNFSRLFMFYSRSWMIYRCILFIKYSCFLIDFDDFFKIFQKCSWISRFFMIFKGFFLHLILSHHDLVMYFTIYICFQIAPYLKVCTFPRRRTSLLLIGPLTCQK